ncbi:MAG: hypothetical protein KDC26_03160 [Armatimonadetes bacterium]|nr:hypothetical protein [Armatimonadota bacterium]
MEDIKRRDKKVFLKEAFSLSRLIAFGAIGGCIAIPVMASTESTFPAVPIALTLLATWGITSYIASIEKRFHDQRFKRLWDACVDRRKRLEEALQALRKKKIGDLQELPGTVERLSNQLYLALRRADLVHHEIVSSEYRTAPPVGGSPKKFINDMQAQELYKVADRNIAEYSHHFKNVMSGVERAEAQAVVFATTLDTLRIRMLNYRLSGNAPEAESMEFLNMITEAKMEFEAIDKALEEIALTPFPETIATIKPTPFPSSNLREVDEEDAARKQAIAELNSELGLDHESLGGPPPVPPHAIKKEQEDQA